MIDETTTAASPSTPSLLRRYWAELCMFLLIGLSLGIIAFQHDLFGRDIVMKRGDRSSPFTFNGYTDKVNQGQSVMHFSRPYEWDCSIRSGFSLPYCAYEIVLDGNGATRGMDLRNLETVELVLDYKGPPSTIRFNLKNEDPRYSTHGDRGTAKVNRSEVSIKPGRNLIKLTPLDFSVAEWWLSTVKVTPELGRTQFDNIVAVELVSGSYAPLGEIQYSIESLRLVRSAISPDSLYLYILSVLTVAMILYGLLRLRRSREEAREHTRLETVARDALADAKRVAEEASEAKSEFLASMSHELRTPLNAVLGYAQLLERTELPEKAARQVQVIRRSGTHLLTLITDILDIAKIEAGKMELSLSPCDLRGMVGAVEDMVRAPAEQKGLSLTCTVAEEVAGGIEADGKRLKQILLNLLGNAVKFTSLGKVSLIVSQRAQTDETVTLRFEVQDSGPGIAPEDLEKIFRPFEQVGDLTQREGGTGLGLTITGQLLGLMHSGIQVESRVGQGSTFWFDLTVPVVQVTEGGAALDTRKVTGYVGTRRNILIVDDQSANRDMLQAVLDPLGFECTQARNGVEALQQAQAARPDLILLDLNMPVMDGFETMRIMGMIDTLKTVPVIVLTANVADEVVKEAMDGGADGFISKPVDHAELLAAMGRICAIDWTMDEKQAA